MRVAVCRIELYLPQNGSLKGKRQVLSSLCERVRRKYHVAVAEVDAHDLWQRAVLGVACVGNESRHVNQVMDSLLTFMRATPSVELIDSKMEIL